MIHTTYDRLKILTTIWIIETTIKQWLTTFFRFLKNGCIGDDDVWNKIWLRNNCVAIQQYPYLMLSWKWLCFRRNKSILWWRFIAVWIVTATLTVHIKYRFKFLIITSLSTLVRCFIIPVNISCPNCWSWWKFYTQFWLLTFMFHRLKSLSQVSLDSPIEYILSFWRCFVSF